MWVGVRDMVGVRVRVRVRYREGREVRLRYWISLRYLSPTAAPSEHGSKSSAFTLTLTLTLAHPSLAIGVKDACSSVSSMSTSTLWRSRD